MDATTATATDTAVKTVKLRNVFDIVTLTLWRSVEDVPSFNKHKNGTITMTTSPKTIYFVTGSGAYATSHGLMVGDTRTLSFDSLEKARTAANGWFKSLVNSGFQRIV